MNDLQTCSELDRLAAEVHEEDFDAAFADHTASCEVCAKAGAESLYVSTALSSLRENVSCPPELLASAIAAAASRPADRAPFRPVPKPAHTPRWVRVGAVALALLLAVGGAWSLRGGNPSVPEPEMAVVPIRPQNVELEPVQSEEALVKELTPPAIDAPSLVTARSAEAPSRSRAVVPSARRAAPPERQEPEPLPQIASAPVDSVAIATEQVYLALAIVGRTQARAEATVIDQIQRVESTVRAATSF